MSNINIVESLRNIDNATYNKYNLLSMYEACNLSDEDKMSIAKMISDNETPEALQQKLELHFNDDNISDLDAFQDYETQGKFYDMMDSIVNTMMNDYDTITYNKNNHSLHVVKDNTELDISVMPEDNSELGEYVFYLNNDYAEPFAFTDEDDAKTKIIAFTESYVKEKCEDHINIDECNDDMKYEVYDIVEDEGRLVAKCMNEAINSFEDIRLGKVNSEAVNKMINGMLHNPNYNISDDVKEKLIKQSGPWGLTVQITPNVDIAATNALLDIGNFSGEASFGESIETDFEKGDRVTDGERKGTVIDCDSNKVLIEWDYSDTEDIEWVDKSEIKTISNSNLKESTCILNSNNNLKLNKNSNNVKFNESVAPYKKRELSKEIQDELYNTATDKMLHDPTWGFESLNDIDDFIGLIIEVNEYNGDYDNDLVAEIRGEFDYDELMDLCETLDKVIIKYDKSAYFEPVTAGIARAYIKLNNIKESISDTDEYVDDTSDGHWTWDYDDDELANIYGGDTKYDENPGGIDIDATPKFVDRRKRSIIYGDDDPGFDEYDLNESMNGFVRTYCDECGKINRVEVEFKDFNKPFEDTIYTCSHCGAENLLTDPHEYNDDGTIKESIDGWDDRTGIIKRIDIYLAHNANADKPVGYIDRNSREYEILSSRYGNYVTTPFSNISTVDLLKYAKDHGLYDGIIKESLSDQYVDKDGYVAIDNVANYITDRYDGDLDDRYACINSLTDSFKEEGKVSTEVIDQFAGAHNLTDKLEESIKLTENSLDDLDPQQTRLLAYNRSLKDIVRRMLDDQDVDVFEECDRIASMYSMPISKVKDDLNKTHDRYAPKSIKENSEFEDEKKHPYVGKRFRYLKRGSGAIYGKVFTVTRAYDTRDGVVVRHDSEDGQYTITAKPDEYRLLKNTANESVEDVEEDNDLISAEQEFDSAATSINSNKLPAVYSMVKFNPGDVVVDFGGGKFDNAVNYLKDQDVTLLVYDPYNRSAEHNKEVLRVLKEHGGADAAINSNVLNVIKEPEARNAVLQNIKKITKKGAPIYITVYEGTGKGNEGPTKSGYQLNRKTADYMDEINQVFSNVKRKGKLITAMNESINEDSDSEIPYTREQVEDDIRRLTKNFTVSDDVLTCGYEEEADYAEDTLKQHYSHVNVDKAGSWFKVAFSGRIVKEKLQEAVDEDPIIDWLSEHEQAWEDFTHHFADKDIESLSEDEIIGWISDHDTLYRDFKNKFPDKVDE